MQQRAPEPWLVAAVAAGLQRLVLLRLDGAPAADAIEGCALAWADALAARAGWIEARDAPRLNEAFRRLAAHAVRWPAPAMLFDHLPQPRPPEALAAPAPDPRERERIRRALGELLQGLKRMEASDRHAD
jgi:hypothetical protein